MDDSDDFPVWCGLCSTVDGCAWAWAAVFDVEVASHALVDDFDAVRLSWLAGGGIPESDSGYGDSFLLIDHWTCASCYGYAAEVFDLHVPGLATGEADMYSTVEGCYRWSREASGVNLCITDGADGAYPVARVLNVCCVSAAGDPNDRDGCWYLTCKCSERGAHESPALGAVVGSCHKPEPADVGGWSASKVDLPVC